MWWAGDECGSVLIECGVGVYGLGMSAEVSECGVGVHGLGMSAGVSECGVCVYGQGASEMVYGVCVCGDLCFDRFITIFLQKSLILSAMILGSFILTLKMLETEYSGFGDQYHAF